MLAQDDDNYDGDDDDGDECHCDQCHGKLTAIL